MATGFNTSPTAISRLDDLQVRQDGLPRLAALAWERAAFAEVFDRPEPGERIRRFLGKA
ncbi:hypothetical protein [Geothrix sp. 21YS21S-4]|uniref:hypothetical protein n=1 Tax=Geothrix sp. 21YS21S-4 TaxID=3068889 RepID=UPI0027BABC14|nr:hypothetical protein [Geothrix sp. 21YS21S-4]